MAGTRLDKAVRRRTIGHGKKHGRKHGCDSGKTRWPDRPAADAALRTILARPRSSAPHRVYGCDSCQGWHLTSRRVRGT
jgi:hypothetical protein